MISSTRHARCLLVACLLVAALLVFVAPLLSGQEKEPAASQERLRALLIQRRDVLRELVPRLQKVVDMGLRDPEELRFALSELCQTETDLCTTQAERIEVRQQLVAALTEMQQRIEAQVEVAVIPKWQAQKAKAITLQARIDLECLRLGRQLSH